MKKTSFFLLAMCMSLAIVLAVEPAAAWFEALPLANSAEDTGKLAEGHFGKAIRLLKQENFQDAIVEYEKVIKLLPKSKIAQDAQYWIGQTYFRMGQLDEALSIFEKLIKDYPGSAIVPVTQLMMARVQQEKENEKLRKSQRHVASQKGIIIDSNTGVKYTKTKTFVGKRDVIDCNNSGLNLSPNSKFLLLENLVVPWDSGDPFELVDMPAGRGTWSPDGKKVAFYSKNAIWVMPVSPETGRSTGPPRKLLDGKYRYQSNVSWSPDGENLAFQREDEEISGDIWTISVRDGSLTQITRTPEREHAPAWSPDGKTIAYGKSGKKQGLGLWISSVDGETARKIIDSDYRCAPIWSPDGKWIFLYETLRFIRLADKKEYSLTTPEEVGAFFSWSPDGKKMLFSRPSYDYTSILKVVSSSGGSTLQLGRELGLWPYVHFWSPDSKMIITKGGYPIDMKYFDDLAFWIIPLAGGDVLQLELNVSVIGKPQPRSLSPDCKRLLFFVEQGEGKEDLYVAPVSLEDARTTGPAVMVFGGRDKKPVGYGKMDEWAWSPDGSKLALIHDGDIWITSAEEGKPVRITKSPEQEIWLVWSPDGEMIAYMNRGREEQILHVISVSGGEAKEILNTPAGRDQYAWSPDAKEIAVISQGVLSAISIAGGKTREILDLKHQGFVDDKAWGLSWLPDGKYLAFVSHNISQKGEEEPTRIFMVPAKGGKVTELAADDDYWKDWLYPSPDGKWISYGSEGEVKVRSEGAIWEVDVKEFLYILLLNF